MSASWASSNSGQALAAIPEPTALQRAILALEKMKTRLDAVERAANEPIAIVGAGCHFPGGDGLDAFWRILDDGKDTVREIPADRWPLDAVGAKAQEAQWAALVDNISHFDAQFFGISPREAESLDPQQRMLLEVTWEALENAGQRPDLLSGSRTGVFIGTWNSDYRQLVGENRENRYDAYCATGSMSSTIAGRISFVFGFQGPAMAIDTACSSSLVAIAQACHSLRTGDSDLAIAGGVNAILSPRMMALAVELKALSPDGRCKTLDARANGFVRGEGCGIAILKRLSDAHRDNDRIYGVIRGWAVNQDGRSAGLTAPNVAAQQAMLQQALEHARLSPADIGYVEMHGTGTPLGDPIEAEALKAVLGVPRTDRSHCVLGSVKSNVGHLESAAGIAGVIKVLLALEHEKIPKNLHFRRLNPRISFDGTPLVVASSPTPWPRSAKPRRAGVSSFGLSGTNAHLIIEEPAPPNATASTLEHSYYLLPLSAKVPQGLSALARSYAGWLSNHNEISLHDVAYTASARRTHHPQRVALIAGNRDELTQLLHATARNESPTGVMRPIRTPGATSKIVFVFPGQGSQWIGMGRELLAQEPVFREAMEACDVAIKKEADFSILEQIAANETNSRTGEIDVLQPLLFAIEVALAALWQSWGIVADCVVGHSMGEVAAAHVAGMLTLEDAMKVICRRSRLLRRIRGQGAMAQVELSQTEAESAIAGYERELAIAVINGPRSTVVAGNPGALENVLAKLQAKGVYCRRINVDVASHSPQVEPLRNDLLTELHDVRPIAGKMHLRSTVTAVSLQGPELSAVYWSDNLRQPVRFSQVIRDLIREGFLTFLEMSPHPILSASIEENLAASQTQGTVLASWRRNTSERRTMLEALGTLYANGHDVDWTKLYAQRGRVVSLPSYPWQKEYYWAEAPKKSNKAKGSGIHPLLGIRFDSSIAPGEHVWQQSLSVDAFPYLADHAIDTEVVFPGTGYVEMALAAASAVYGPGTVIIDEMSLDHMLALAPDTERQVQLVLQKDDEGFAGIGISSRGMDETSWIRHATARVHIDADKRPEAEPMAPIERRCPQKVDADAHYARMSDYGLRFGKTFRGVQTVHIGKNEVFGRISLPESEPFDAAYSIHPALLDACLQGASWALASKLGTQAVVPREFIHLRYYGRPSRQVWMHARLVESPNSGSDSVKVAVYDDNGQVVVELAEMRITPLEGKRKSTPHPLDELLLQFAWQKRELAAQSPTRDNATRAWLVLGDVHGVGRAVATLLRARGETCVEANAGFHYELSKTGEYRLDATDPDQVRSLLHDAFGSKRICKGVLHFMSLNAEAWNGTTTETLSADVRRGCVTALRLAQTLLVQGWRDVPRLYLFTRGVHAVDRNDTSIAVSQAGIWGLGRTLALEHPALECTRVDLSCQSMPDEAEKIVRELFAKDGEDQVALRPSGRFVARMIRSTIEAVPQREFAFHADRTYLITGGLGGLGLELASWMVNQGVRHLLLIGRSAPSPQANAIVDRLKHIGASVRVAQVDVSHQESVAALLSAQKLEMPPLAGIVHAAVALEDRTLMDLSEESFLSVMGAKALGALHLHLATLDIPLDFFVLYSSGAGVLGSPGQSNYSSANTIVDAIARARSIAGLPATSIAWGAFTDVGLAAAQDNRGKRLEARGFDGISPETGHAIFHQLLLRPRAEIAAIRLSVRQWEDFYPQSASLPLLSELRTETPATTAENDSDAFRQLYDSSRPHERPRLLEKLILEHLGRVIRLEPSRIDPNATFVSLGMDSLMSLELRNRLQASLKLDLRATLLFTYPTTTKLVGFILEQLAPAPQRAETLNAPSTREGDSKLANQIATMGADDLLAMLDDEIAAIKK